MADTKAAERRSRICRGCLAVVTAVATLGSASPAGAEPQGNAGLLLGGGGRGPKGRFWDVPVFHLGARGDVLFGRDGPHDFGLGPYAEVSTFAFDQVQFGGGASFLLPVDDIFPIVASLGGHGRWADDDLGWAPGIGGSLFFGTRSYNFHENYVMAAGLVVGLRHSFGTPDETVFHVGVQADFAAIAIPFIFLGEAIAGPSDEAAPID